MVLLRKVSSADSNPVNGTVRFRRIYWLNPTNIGDTIVLQDSMGNEIITLRCEAANQSQFLDFDSEGLGQYTGHKISTLASGTVYLYG